MAGEGELELARGEVPDLDDSVACAGGEPLVPGLDGDGADPAEVTRDDAGELPYWNVEDERQSACAEGEMERNATYTLDDRPA